MEWPGTASVGGAGLEINSLGFIVGMALSVSGSAAGFLLYRQRKGKAQIAKSRSGNLSGGAAGPDFFGIAYMLIAEFIIAFADGIYYFDTLLNGLYERVGHALVRFGGTAKKARTAASTSTWSCS